MAADDDALPLAEVFSGEGGRSFCVLAHVCLVRYLHACCIHDISCALQQAGSQLPLLACRAGKNFVRLTGLSL